MSLLSLSLSNQGASRAYADLIRAQFTYPYAFGAYPYVYGARRYGLGAFGYRSYPYALGAAGYGYPYSYGCPRLF